MRQGLVVAQTVKRQNVARKQLVLHNKRIKSFCLLILVSLCLALIFVWTRIEVVQLGYDISKLHSQIRDLSKEENLLQSEVAKLKSPARLEAMAKGELGMRLPFGDEIIFIEP